VTEDRIREFVHGDEARIVDLFNSTFGTHRTLDRWAWQFGDNPQGAPWITLAESDGELVGQYCMMRNHLNFGGQEICAGQSCDTMVRPDQRGRGWFVRLSEACYSQASAQGLKVVFGFPNRNSLPGFVRSLGWHRITALRAYYCRTSIRHFAGTVADFAYRLLFGFRLWLREMVLRKTVKGGRVVTTREIPLSVESLLKEIQNYEIFSVWKDLPYLKWRYERHPEHQYLVHVLYVGDSAEGIIVVRNSGQSVAICELLHRTKDVSQSAYLLNAVLRHHARSSLQRMEFFGHDDGFFDSVFRRCGFAVSYANSFIFCGRVFANDGLEKRFVVPQNWTVAYGDTDVI
jgi:hypothetical protein